jgi:hypothetical protein
VPYDLSNFDLGSMLQCSGEIAGVPQHARTMEEAAQAFVEYFRDSFRDPETGAASCPLVRFYRTLDLERLDPATRAFAIAQLDGAPPAAGLQCLTLLATVGDEPDWNSVSSSRGHRAIPLTSIEVVRQAPMIAALIEQFGLSIAEVLNPAPTVLRDRAGKSYNVFHVEDARSSPLIPARDGFVVPYGIRSVVGFGGLLWSGDLYAIILFSRAHVNEERANLFRMLALDVRAALRPLRGG